MNMTILFAGLAPAALYFLAFLVCFTKWLKELKEMKKRGELGNSEKSTDMLSRMCIALILAGTFAAIAIGASLIL